MGFVVRGSCLGNSVPGDVLRAETDLDTENVQDPHPLIEELIRPGLGSVDEDHLRPALDQGVRGSEAAHSPARDEDGASGRVEGP